MGKAVAISAILVADQQKIRLSSVAAAESSHYGKTCLGTSGKAAHFRIPSILSNSTVDSVKFLRMRPE